MRVVGLAVVALASGTLPAAAAPAAMCDVSVSEAPDDVRAAIESALTSEAACGLPLTVRVVVTERGLLVDAHDARGRARSRVVPDAQTAAVLVASWAADDRVTPVAAAKPTGDAEIVPAALSTVSADATPPVAPRNRWLTAAGTVGESRGLRGEIDLLGARWTLGLAVSFRMATIRTYGEESDVSAIEYVALTKRTGRWHARASLGVGVMRAHLRMVNTYGQTWADGSDFKFVTEASAILGYDVGEEWAVTGGVLLTVLPDPTISILEMSVQQDLSALAPQLIVGVSRRL